VKSSTEPVRNVVLIDDHPLLGMGLDAGLGEKGIRLCILDPRADNLISQIRRCVPSLVVIDLSMPIEGGGLSLIRPVADLGVPVVVLTGETDRSQWAEAVYRGAETILSKGEPIDEIFDAIVRMSLGVKIRPHQKIELEAERRYGAASAAQSALFDQLTPREELVLQALVEGISLRDFADSDGVSVHTVRTQAKSVLRKLRVHSQLEAVALARNSGWGSRVPTN